MFYVKIVISKLVRIKGGCGDNDNESTHRMHEVKGCCGVARCLGQQPLMGLYSHPQPPLVQTHTVTIAAVSNSLPSGISTTEVPIVPTKTVTYESSKVGAPAPAQPRSASVIWPISLHEGDGSTVVSRSGSSKNEREEALHTPW